MGPSVCCHVLAVCVAVMATICCANRAQYFITGTNRRCSGVLPDVFTAVSAAGCCRKCLGESSCLAVNYSPTTMECQLCDGTVENDPAVEGQDAWRVYLTTMESDPTSSTAHPVVSDPTPGTTYPVVSDPTLSTTHPGGCGEGWTHYNSSCYWLEPETRLTWVSAEDNCMGLGARLVEIGDQQENDFLFTTFVHPTLWIGLNRNNQQGILVWPSGAPVGYLNIMEGHEDLATERCFIMGMYSQQWGARDCSSLMYSVCEKSLFQ